MGAKPAQNFITIVFSSLTIALRSSVTRLINLILLRVFQAISLARSMS